MTLRVFRPNVPFVTSEDFGDEVVVVNFDTGRYHSLRGSAFEVWRLVEKLVDEGALLDFCRARWDAPADVVDDAVRDLLAALEREGLVATADAAGEPPAAPREKVAFEAPVLATYTDMQELLWLDPIHDVDETGWPVAKRVAEPR